MFSRRHHHRQQPCSVWVDDPHIAKPRVAEWLEDRTLLSANAASDLFGSFSIQLTSVETASAADSDRPFAARIAIVNLTPVDPADDVAIFAEPTEIGSLDRQDFVSTVLALDLAQLVNRTAADTESLEAAFSRDSTFEFTGELFFGNEFDDESPLSLLGLLDSAEASLPTESSDSANWTASYSASVTAIGRLGALPLGDLSASRFEITLTAFVGGIQSLSVSTETQVGGDQLDPSFNVDATFSPIVAADLVRNSELSDSAANGQLMPSDSERPSFGDASRIRLAASTVPFSSASANATSPATLGQQGSELLFDFAPTGSVNGVNGEEVGLRRLASYSRFTSSNTDQGPQAASVDSLTTSIAARSERSLTEFSASVAGAIAVTQQFEGNWIEPLQPIIGLTGSLLLAVQSLGKSVLLGVFGDSGSGDGPLAAFVEPILEQVEARLFEAPDHWELKTVEPHYEAAFTRLAQSERHFEIRNIGPVGDAAAVEVALPTSFTILSPPQHGQLELIASRSMRFHYQPDPGFSGVDSFRYRATAADGTSLDGIIVLTVKPGSQRTHFQTALLANDVESEISVATLEAEQTANRFEDVIDSFGSFEDWRGDLD